MAVWLAAYPLLTFVMVLYFEPRLCSQLGRRSSIVSLVCVCVCVSRGVFAPHVFVPQRRAALRVCALHSLQDLPHVAFGCRCFDVLGTVPTLRGFALASLTGCRHLAGVASSRWAPP